MLVLSRKINQEILIGDNVRVKVIEIKGNQIRLGIVAPAEVSIVRDELWAKNRAMPCEGPRRQQFADGSRV